MRIGLNLLHAVPNIGGVWNYVEGLLAGLAKYDKKNEYICYVTEQSRGLIPDATNFISKIIHINAGIRLFRVLYENSFFHWHIERDKLDVLHWFSGTQSLFCRVPSAVSVYDTLVFDRPGAFPLIKRGYLRAAMEITSRQASVIMPMSRTTAANLERILCIERQKLIIIPPVIVESFYPRPQEDIERFCLKFSLPDQFWLYVADFYPHKNHLYLINAVHNLKNAGNNVWPVVLRGSDKGAGKEMRRLITELKIEKNFIFLPRLDLEEMALLYSAADALIYPSSYEGGGIPLLEAMACGCPIAASNIPTTLEMADNAVFLFEKNSTRALEDGIRSLQEDIGLRSKLSYEGIALTKKNRACMVIQNILHGYQEAKNNFIKTKGAIK